MTLKIRKIGNSQGIVIPKKLLEEVGLKSGESVVVEKDNGGKLTIYKEGTTHSSLSPEFIKKVEKVKKEYKEALQNLANK